MQNYPPPLAQNDPPVRRTSKLGKASLLIALTIFLMVVLSIVVLTLLIHNDTRSDTALVGFTMIGWVLAPSGHFIGLVLGIVDVCRSRSKKLVPALGIAANAILGGIGITLLIMIANLLVRAMGAVH